MDESFEDYVMSLPSWFPGCPYWSRYRDNGGETMAIRWYERPPAAFRGSGYLWLLRDKTYSMGNSEVDHSFESLPSSITTWAEAEKYVDTIAALCWDEK